MVNTKKNSFGNRIRSLAESCFTSDGESISMAARAPGPSFKPQAPSFASIKPQASSPKLQAASFKPQASSSLIREPRYIWKRFVDLGPRVSVKINVLCGCLIWNAIWCGENFNFIPLVTFNSIVKKWPLVLLTNRSGVPRELRFSSLVNENWGQALRNFWYSLASGPTYFFEVTVSLLSAGLTTLFLLDVSDTSIPIIEATSPYGLVHKYCNNCFPFFFG